MFLIDEDEVDGRGERWDHKRIDWPLHVKKILNEKCFLEHTLCPHAAFTYLCIILHPILEHNHAKNRDKESIILDMTVGC